MYNPDNDVLELSGCTMGMCLICVEGKFYFGRQLTPETMDDAKLMKRGPYDSLREAVANLNSYLKIYGGDAALTPACFDEQGNPQHPEHNRFCKGRDW